jgi:serine/threonine-protein kinase RsbW
MDSAEFRSFFVRARLQGTIMDTNDAVLAFRVPPEPLLSRLVRDAVAELARSRGVGEDDLAHFQTALGEALANAIEHARSRTPIEVEVRLSHDRIVATVQDGGIGFATERVVDPTLPDPSAERGRGLPIMRRCSDIFAIESVPGKGTAVVIGRFLRPTGRAAGLAS